MWRARYYAVLAMAVVGIAAVPPALRAAVWENDPAKLCEITILDKEVQLTNAQREAIAPVPHVAGP